MHMKIPFCRILFIGAVFTVISYAVQAQMTDNSELRAIPVPEGRSLKVDGTLKGWDTSGEIFSCYDVSELAERFSVRTMAMYDRDNLYIACHFKDSTPLFNNVNPVTQPGEGWRGDCLQMRIWTDPEKPVGPQGGRVAHFDCNYYTPEKKSVVRIIQQDIGHDPKPEKIIDNALSEGVEEAFSLDADGKGYIQEIKIPFKLLRRDGRPYRAGESLRMGLEFLWGDAAGSRFPIHRFADLINPQFSQREFFWARKDVWGELKFMAHGKLPPAPTVGLQSKSEELKRVLYATKGIVPFEYKLPADGFATLVVETPDGDRIRNWISDYPRHEGKNIDYWDGRNDAGQVVPPGDYIIRGLYHGPFDVKYEFNYGNPGNPPWETPKGDGAWLSDHAATMACAASGDRVFLAASTSEEGNTVIGVDLKGQKQWGIGRLNGGVLALHGNYLYMVDGGYHGAWNNDGKLRVLRIDTQKGSLLPFAGGKPDLAVASYPVDRPTVKPREWAGILVANHGFDAEWCQAEAMGLASDGNRLYLSLFYEDKIIAFDPENGQCLEEIPLQRPAGLGVTPSGDLLAISGKCVVKIGKDKKAIPFIDKGLDAPVGLTVDRAGNVYVSDWGASMCVKKFSPDGKLMHTIGTVGGRPLRGAYDPNGMFLPWGLAVDSDGKLWVAEDDMSPKRVSVWDKDAKFWTEFCGTGWYGSTESNIDTTDPSRAFWGGTVLDLDWKTGKWRVASTLWRPIKPSELIGPRGETLANEAREMKGRKLLITTGPITVISQLDGNSAHPIAGLGSVRSLCGEGADDRGGSDQFSALVLEKLFASPDDLELAKKEFPKLFSGTGIHTHRFFGQMLARFQQLGKPLPSQFIWSDTNGDGAVQPDELRLFRPQDFGGFESASAWGSAPT